MNEEEALLQAVLEHPDDDGPRLAYAEWAERQPEESIRARAAFIRAQIAILRMDDAAIDRGNRIGLRSFSISCGTATV
jgi:uncharacterized protein (TIGR02996 family)